MDKMQTLIAQRDGLSRYIFERNDGDLYESHCRLEMEKGRCPYRDHPKDTERSSGVCVPCIVKLIGEGTAAPPSPFLSLLSEHHLLVSYFAVGGTLGTGHVQAVEDGVITFESSGKTTRYRLEEIDVIVPKEVLRWSHDELAPATWGFGREDSAEQDETAAPCEDIAACLLSIGIQPFMEGFTELESAIRLAAKDPALLNRLGDTFYPALAKETGKSAGTVAYHISRLIRTAKRNSRFTGDYLLFYSVLQGCNVSVKEFLLTFLRYMRHREIPSL